MLLHALVEWMGVSPASRCSAQLSEGTAPALLEGKPLQGPLSLWRAQSHGDHSTSWNILTLVMIPGFGLGGSCESVAGRRCVLPGPRAVPGRGHGLGWGKV